MEQKDIWYIIGMNMGNNGCEEIHRSINGLNFIFNEHGVYVEHNTQKEQLCLIRFNYCHWYTNNKLKDTALKIIQELQEENLHHEEIEENLKQKELENRKKVLSELEKYL